MFNCKTQGGKGNEEPKTLTGFKRNPRIYAGELINAPRKPKFGNCVNEIKETTYDSYWKKPLGTTRNQAPLLAAGSDIRNVSFGRKNTETSYGLLNPWNTPIATTPLLLAPLGTTLNQAPLLAAGSDIRNVSFGRKNTETSYGLLNPWDTSIATTPLSLEPGYQLDRKYRRPAYNPSQIFGNISQPDMVAEMVGQLGQPATPNDNSKLVPVGYAFGKLNPLTDNVPDCFTTCRISAGREFVLKCLGHLNVLRRCLSKLYDDQFFRQFYLRMEYLDNANTGWLPKDVIYNYCSAKNVTVNPTLIEPLLEMWNAFDGSQIQYRVFVDMINYIKPSPSIPKIPDMAVECGEYSTSYNDMMRPGQEVDKRPMAGLPSASFFDKDEVVTSWYN